MHGGQVSSPDPGVNFRLLPWYTVLCFLTLSLLAALWGSGGDLCQFIDHLSFRYGKDKQVVIEPPGDPSSHLRSYNASGICHLCCELLD